MCIDIFSLCGIYFPNVQSPAKLGQDIRARLSKKVRVNHPKTLLNPPEPAVLHYPHSAGLSHECADILGDVQTGPVTCYSDVKYGYENDTSSSRRQLLTS